MGSTESINDGKLCLNKNSSPTLLFAIFVNLRGSLLHVLDAIKNFLHFRVERIYLRIESLHLLLDIFFVGSNPLVHGVLDRINLTSEHFCSLAEADLHLLLDRSDHAQPLIVLLNVL